MHFRFVLGAGLSILGLLPLNPASAAPQPLNPSVQIRFLLSAATGSKPVRMVKDPRDNALYYLKQSGSIYRIALNSGTGTSTSTLVYGSADHSISSASGLAIGPDGTIYVVGNTTTNNNNSTFATIMKGVANGVGGRTWSNLARTEPYPRSKTAFDHVFNGIVVSPDGQFIFLNSGARTDHGEEQSVGGVFPGAREVPLTAKVFRLPAAGSNLVLSNNFSALQSAGYLYAEGIRNTYDFAFAPNGDLFGTENGPDRDMSEELNWLREGLHFGFPWRLGGADNPQQFPGYDPATDRLLDPRFVAVQNGYYHDDPSFPPPPTAFAEPVINLGPDADSFRDPGDGSIKDSSDAGRTLSTFTAHRSPLGLVFDTAGVLSPEFRNHGFMLSWTPGDPSGAGVAGPFRDPGQDLLDLDLTKLGNTNYQARVTRLVGGFSNPIDAEIIGNHVYVIEYGGSTGIWEITLPVEPDVTTASASNVAVTAATVSGTVNPNGVSATAWFEWGTNTNYGMMTPPQNAGSGTNAIAIAQDLGGLLPGGTYHFRIVASNSFTVTYGTDRTFTTTNQNSPPVAQDDIAATPEDSILTLSAASLLANDSDVDSGDMLTVTSVSSASAQGGTATLDNGSVTYVPPTNYFGTDTFTYAVTDGQTPPVEATVTVTVSPVNDPPLVALTLPTNNAAFSAHSTMRFVAGASDPDGTVGRVEFHVNPALTLTATNIRPGEFTAMWTNVPAGNYSVTADAVDDQNATNSSATINFTVVDLRLDLPAFSSDGSLQFDLIGAPGNIYRVDASTNFLDWDPLSSVLATNGTVRITDPAATNRWYRYYRARVP